MATARGRQQGVACTALDTADARLAIVPVDEVTEVGTQRPIPYSLTMQQVEVALLVDVLQLRMPDADQRTLLVETLLGTGVVETVRSHPWRSPGRKILHVRRVAQANLTVLASLQAQTFDFA